MEQLTKRVDKLEKKVDDMNGEVIRNVDSIKTLKRDNVKLENTLDNINTTMSSLHTVMSEFKITMVEFNMRLKNEEGETKRKNFFKDNIILRVICGVLAVLGAGLVALTLLGVGEWFLRIK